MKHQHILVIRFSAMGDVAMTVPIVWAVAHQYPDVRITVLSRAFARPFFENLAPNVNFMVHPCGRPAFCVALKIPENAFQYGSFQGAAH